MATVKSDIERELELEDLKKLQQGIQQGSQEFKREVENSIHSGISSVNRAVDDIVDGPPAQNPPTSKLENDPDGNP